MRSRRRLWTALLALGLAAASFGPGNVRAGGQEKDGPPGGARGIRRLGPEVGPAGGQEKDGPPGEQWVVFIAVKQYAEPALSLAYPLEDAKALRTVLVERAGVPGDHVLELTDESPPERRPTLANLRRALPEFLRRAKPRDRVLVFFNGHGMRDRDTTYLVPADASRDDLAGTALPMAELRGLLAKCPAGLKFLVLDCCHAAATRAAPGGDVPAGELAKALEARPVPGLVVLASCQAKEHSWEWNERRMGLFSYWLARALEGGADANGDGALSVDEVYGYTFDRVTGTAKNIFGRAQTPMRLHVGDVAGVPTLLALRPEPPESVCRRLAAHLDVEIRAHKLQRVGVLEFLMPLGNVVGLPRAHLPGFCAAQVRDELARLSRQNELPGGGYQVLGEGDLKRAAKGVGAEDIGDAAALARLSDRAGGLDGLVTGIMKRRGDNVHLKCELVATAKGNTLGEPAGLFPLSEDLAGDLGASFDNRGRPQGGPYAALVVGHALKQAERNHPALSKQFPFKVEVWSVRAEPGQKIGPKTPRKKKEFIQLPAAGDAAGGLNLRELCVAAREGEVFEIYVWNHSEQPVAAHVLVDGLNVIGQKRERLGKGRMWAPLEPTTDPEQPYLIAGWYDDRRPGNDLPLTKRFRFVDVAESVAGRQKYGEAIGLITVGLYGERGRALGVGEGPEERRDLGTSDFPIGRLLGVVQIRYVDERDLGK